MNERCDEHRLPAEILSRAHLAGNEYAWRVGDIPSVIEAARRSGLVSLGGQLQFRIPPPHSGTCECYWVEVDTYAAAPETLPWAERVERAANAATSDFHALLRRFDFLAEGKDAFGPFLTVYETAGGSAEDAMYFVWYVLAEPAAGRV